MKVTEICTHCGAVVRNVVVREHEPVYRPRYVKCTCDNGYRGPYGDTCTRRKGHA